MNCWIWTVILLDSKTISKKELDTFIKQNINGGRVVEGDLNSEFLSKPVQDIVDFVNVIRDKSIRIWKILIE